MHHEHDGPCNHEDLLDAHIQVDELKESLEAGAVLKEMHDLKKSHNTQESVQPRKPC